MDSYSTSHPLISPAKEFRNATQNHEELSGHVLKRRILVVDDHPLLRHAVVELIHLQDDLTVCGEADCISKAHSQIEEEEPDMLLLDLRMGNSDTILWIKSIRTNHPSVRVLVLSLHDEILLAERCLRAGADGYITKLEEVNEVINAIRCVLRGETYLSRAMAIALLSKAANAKKSRPSKGVEALTDRELHIFQLIGTGLGTSKIAMELGVSPKTIEAHKEHIKVKIGAANAQELLRTATTWVNKDDPFHG